MWLFEMETGPQLDIEKFNHSQNCSDCERRGFTFKVPTEFAIPRPPIGEYHHVSTPSKSPYSNTSADANNYTHPNTYSNHNMHPYTDSTTSYATSSHDNETYHKPGAAGREKNVKWDRSSNRDRYHGTTRHSQNTTPRSAKQSTRMNRQKGNEFIRENPRFEEKYLDRPDGYTYM